MSGRFNRVVSRSVSCLACVFIIATSPALAGVGQKVDAAPTSSASDLLLNAVTGRSLGVEAVVGSGASSAYLVVDFEATGGGVYAWQYDFDAPASSFDMISAIDAATPLLADLGFFEGLGHFVNDYQYPTYAEDGDAGLFWSFSVGNATPSAGGSVDWAGAPVGMDQRMLTDGDVDGWYNGFSETFDPIDPRVPVIPEPTTAVLAVLGGAALLCCRRAHSA